METLNIFKKSYLIICVLFLAFQPIAFSDNANSYHLNLPMWKGCFQLPSEVPTGLRPNGPPCEDINDRAGLTRPPCPEQDPDCFERDPEWCGLK